MKKHISFISCLSIGMLAASVSLSSCMSDSLNLDPDKIQESELNKDNLWGTYLTTMERRVVPEDQNDYQLAEDLVGNMYAGYFAGTQSWEGGNNGTTYAFPSGWLNRPFKVAFVDFLSSWNVLRQKTNESTVLYAVAEVVKVLAMHKTTDIYGPIPYTRFGRVTPVPYDSQEEVYKTFFKELDHAIGIMTEYDAANPDTKPLEKFDLIYNGEISKWIKFANSLKLRLAMRVSKVYPEAQQIAEAAVNNKYGVIENNTDNPVMQSNSTLSFTYFNPFYNLYSEEGYNEDRMGASMDAYLNGFEDPRLPVFFTKAKDGKYRGLRNGLKNGLKFMGDARLSQPTIKQSDPTLWMNAAEVYFLRAEGALKQWNMKGEARGLYEEGIRKSLEQHGLAAQADAYINSDNKPAKYEGFSSSLSMPAPSDITVAWDDADSKERLLERIITQKWIALYPIGQEAWSEFRRTGYPKIFPIVDNMSDGKVNTQIQVRRLPFPESEYSGNNAEVLKAVMLLGGGPDTGGTRLWWDKE